MMSLGLLSRRSAMLGDLLWLLRRYARSHWVTALIIAFLFLAAYGLQISAFLAAIKYLAWATHDPLELPSLAKQLGLDFVGLSLCVATIIVVTFCSASVSLYWARKLSTETSITMITHLENQMDADADQPQNLSPKAQLLRQHFPHSADALRQMLLSSSSMTNAVLSLAVMSFLKPTLTAALAIPAAILILLVLASTRRQHAAPTTPPRPAPTTNSTSPCADELSSQNSLIGRDYRYRMRMASQSRGDRTRLMFQLAGGIIIGVILAAEAIAIMDNVSTPQELIFYLIAARLATNNFSSLATQWTVIANRASHVRKVRQVFSGSLGNKPV